MEALVNYFSTIPPLHRSLILAGGITFFWLIENAWPLFHFSYNKWRHAGTNLFFTLTTILVNLPLAFLLIRSSDMASQKHFGLLQWWVLPLWAQVIIGLLTMDLVGAWLAHWTQHKVKWMWKFHLIHHADQQVDTTTANRHHPGESLIRFVFTVLAVLVTGAPMWLLFLYQSLSVLLSQFNHANIVLPQSLDRLLSLVFVTPNMHHVHHHFVQPYTDSNYGNIFAIWDRIFGTFQNLPQSAIHYGIDTHPEPAENGRIENLLRIPFQPYRKPNTDTGLN